MQSRHKFFTAVAAVALASALVAGCGSSQSADKKTADSQTAESFKPAGIATADKRLQVIYAQRNKLIGGGKVAFRERITNLTGLPIVVNKWASWCGPCAFEFPFFQDEAQLRGAKVAFLGVNTNDANDEATAFLADYPVPFPSYIDPHAEVANEVGNVVDFPTTAFYDASGKLQHLKRGGYQDKSELAADIERYATASEPTN